LPIYPTPTPDPTAGPTTGPTTPPATIQVPDLIGHTRATALTAITSAGLTLGSDTTVIDHQCNAIDTITSQSPPPGTTVTPGARVSIVVAIRPDHPCP
uniref:PASTA domain-containing protein n=1 Tax=Acrocarpospora catenulata TaxID=2836182 RepID=UPI001BDA4C54